MYALYTSGQEKAVVIFDLSLNTMSLNPMFTATSKPTNTQTESRHKQLYIAIGWMGRCIFRASGLY